jgi:hypothetical protein
MVFQPAVELIAQIAEHRAMLGFAGQIVKLMRIRRKVKELFTIGLDFGSSCSCARPLPESCVIPI